MEKDVETLDFGMEAVEEEGVVVVVDFIWMLVDGVIVVVGTEMEEDGDITLPITGIV